MASSPTDYTVAGQGGQAGHDLVFANNLNPDATLVRAAQPFVGTAVPPLTWIPLTLDQPFSYDPSQGEDFVLQIRKCGSNVLWGASLDGHSDIPASGGGNRYGDTLDCHGLFDNFRNNEFVPLIRIDFDWAGPTLAVDPMTSGQAPAIRFAGVDPGGMIFLRWSLAGAGPIQLIVGDLEVSQPVVRVAPVFADANGDFAFPKQVPAGMAGETFYAHAVVEANGAFVLTNAEQIAIQ